MILFCLFHRGGIQNLRYALLVPPGLCTWWRKTRRLELIWFTSETSDSLFCLNECVCLFGRCVEHAHAHRCIHSDLLTFIDASSLYALLPVFALSADSEGHNLDKTKRSSLYIFMSAFCDVVFKLRGTGCRWLLHPFLRVVRGEREGIRWAIKVRSDYLCVSTTG